MFRSVSSQYMVGIRRRLPLHFFCSYQSVFGGLSLQVVLLVVVGSLLSTFGLRVEPATVKSIGDIFREGGFREDFAGAARMNKFALAFRIVNNIVCGRCNATGKDEYCLPKLPEREDKCDREDVYYETDIEQQLDTFLPCLMRYSNETILLCLMETPMGVPPPHEDDTEETGDEHTTTESVKEDDEAGKVVHGVIPVRRQELVDIVSHAKITRVIIGDPLAGLVPEYRPTLVHKKGHRGRQSSHKHVHAGSAQNDGTSRRAMQ